jgi:hypothetical protein
MNNIRGVMVTLLASSAVDRAIKAWSGQTKDYKMSKHRALRRKGKEWLALNQENVPEWCDMSIRGLLFQWASTMKIQLSMLVYYKVDLIIISLKINFFLPWYSW